MPRAASYRRRAFTQPGPAADLRWTTNIQIEIVVTKNPRHIPALDTRHTVHLAGNTMHYAIGGGSEPGILATGRKSEILCGMPVSDGNRHTFKPVPALSFLRY